MNPGFVTASSSRAAHETIAFLSAPLRALPVRPCGLEGTATLGSPAVGWIVISSVMVFSPFLPCFLRGTYAQGAWAPAAAFAGEPKKSRLFRLIFSGGDRNPEGRRSRKPSLRPQGAQVFARLPCPREEGASEKGSDRRNQARQ